MSREYGVMFFGSALHTIVYVEAYGAMSIEPKKMAALAPAIVMVNGLRKMDSCFDIRDLTRAEGMNREPTAGS
jgi:hypothetical protein